MRREVGLLEARERRLIWGKGQAILGYDPSVWRRDAFGRTIRFSDYGDRDSRYGWEIDHIHPKALGGSDDLSNLRPLHCENNAGLGGILGSLLRTV
ncbi:MAG TPA: HNH endonuclease signature motif containing protein [Microvirga sp.]|nr:HNH endonuclease signature motif containing protein [Microvirga sp.]